MTSLIFRVPPSCVAPMAPGRSTPSPNAPPCRARCPTYPASSTRQVGQSSNLPILTHIFAQGGYRAGLTIGHGSTVSVRCELSTNANPIEMSCLKGVLTPPSIPCESGLRKSREELEHATPTSTAHTKIEHELDELQHLHDNNTEDHGDELKMCGHPSLTDGALVYK